MNGYIYRLFTSDDPEVERAIKLREFSNMALEALWSDPDAVAGVEKCNHSKFVVPPSHGNDFAVPVLVHTPKRIVDQPKKVAMIYAHGGGGVVRFNCFQLNKTEKTALSASRRQEKLT